MVSPETHFVKNHESLSITDESQFKKKQQQQGTLNWKFLGLYVTRQVNLETDTKTLYFYFPSLSLKHKKV